MDNWKREIYRHYSSLFGRSIKRESYSAFYPYGRKIIEKCFPKKGKEIQILDLGCGIGGFIKVFLDAGYTNVEGVDVSEESVSMAHTYGLFQVKQGDIFAELNLRKENSYDVILFLDVIEHFKRKEILSLMKSAFEKLRPGGRVILHVPNAEGVFGSKIRYSDITHEMAFTANSLTQITRFAGFSEFSCFEDKPIIHGLTSFFRRCIWEVGTISFRLLHASESGLFSVRLSQNILFIAIKH